MVQESRYREYDVMKEKDAWDEHTRSIVEERLQPSQLAALTMEEIDTLRHLCPLFVDDNRAEVIDYAIIHIDSTLSSTSGESQRKVGVPKAAELIRGGLQRIEQGALLAYKQRFGNIPRAAREDELYKLANNMASAQVWGQFPQAEWLKKMLQLTVEAYCSHPVVWSEIGYGGPAYPRGYVRTELGMTDPWEAKAKP